MPTPSDRVTQLTFEADPHLERLAHTICPPDTERSGTRIRDERRASESDDGDDVAPRARQEDCAAAMIEATGPVEAIDHNDEPAPIHTSKSASNINKMDVEQQPLEGASPMSISTDTTTMTDTTITAESKAQEQSPVFASSAHMTETLELCSPSASHYGIPNVRMIPTQTSSFLRHGSKFRGTQQSDKQQYKVEVEIKYVDMKESFLCGYLRIEGLTEDHPTLTTHFEGEIIGTKYTFQTRHPSWGATDKTDMQHWARFPAWRPLAKQAKKPDFHYKNNTERENIFMRWKEGFLVPDHKVREIMGASFEGFYYICFNQVVGSVSGIYFHAKSEKYQQLELTHVPDHGCFGAMEFR